MCNGNQVKIHPMVDGVRITLLLCHILIIIVITSAFFMQTALRDCSHFSGPSSPPSGSPAVTVEFEEKS